MQPDYRRHRPRPSPLSIGLQWASAITSIGMEMALPPLAGAWLDSRLGTSPLWTVLLAILGFGVAMRHLWQLAARLGGAHSGDTGGRGRGRTPPPDQPAS